MNLDVWAVWPTVSPERSNPLVLKWIEMGYNVAVLVNPPHKHTDIPNADRVVVQDVWEGFSVAANALCRAVPGDIVVVVGDDLFPDEQYGANELAERFVERFPDLFGVAQPIGDVYGLTHRCAVSPWIGRKFIDEAYGGNGPYWTEYYHYFADHELQLAAEQLGVFDQWKDVTQFHDHWQRGDGPKKRPRHLRKARREHSKDQTLCKRRIKKGFPGL